MVKVFSGVTGQQARGFHAFDASMTAGVRVAAAYVTDDAFADVVVSTGPGVPDRVRVFDGLTSGRLTGPTGDFGPFGGVQLGGVALAASNDPPTGGDGSGGGGSPPPSSPPSYPEPGVFPMSSEKPVTLYGGHPGQTASVTWLITNPSPDRLDWVYNLTNNSILVEVENGVPDCGIVNFALSGYAGGVFDDSTNMKGWSRQPNTLSWAGGDFFGKSIQPDETKYFKFSTLMEPVVDGLAGSPSTYNELPFPPPPPSIVKVPAEPPTVNLVIPDLVPVNANDNNFNPNTQPATDRWVVGHPFIPRKRDFDVEKLWKVDPQLMPAAIQVFDPQKKGGTVTIEQNAEQTTGNLQYWKDPKKNERFTSAEVPAGRDFDVVLVWVEGKHESIKRDEITLRALYNQQGGFQAKSTDKKIAVTPILSPLPDTKFSTPRVSVDSDVMGLIAGAFGPPAQQGITFTANLTVLDEVMRYSQYVVSEDALTKFSAASGIPDLKLVELAKYHPAGSPPMPLRNRLDNYKETPDDPIYGEQNEARDPNNASATKITMTDSPNVGTVQPVPGFWPVELHSSIVFKTYIVVQYTDGDSLYAISSTQWRAELHGASDNLINGGISKVIAPATVELIGAGWTRNNEDPAVTKGPVALQTIGRWVNA